MAGVLLKNIEKSFGSAHVLKGINVDIEDGAFVVLVGPSGCGKSTLLRIVAGLEDVTSGSVLIGGDEVNDVHPKDRDIAMVFQNYGLYPHMSVAQNMGFALKLSGVDKNEISNRVEAAAKILSLEKLLKRFPRQLSGGQRQRVAMGRAIVRDPKVFLFDEPLSNLDAKLRVQMRAEIKRLHQRLKVTTVYVTHDQVEAMTMADQIVVMHDGVVKQIGSPLELYDTPQNLFVAGFIGSPAMNFLNATYENGAVKFASGASIKVPDTARLDENQKLIVGVRPDEMQLGDTGLKAEITLIEHTGAETYVGAEIDGAPLTIVFKQRQNLTVGETIHVMPDADKIHLFDQINEQRLN